MIVNFKMKKKREKRSISSFHEGEKTKNKLIRFLSEVIAFQYLKIQKMYLK